MVKVGWNYGVKSKCPLCQDEEDRQEHLLTCKKINTSDELNNLVDANHDGFLKRLETAIRRRELILEERVEGLAPNTVDTQTT